MYMRFITPFLAVTLLIVAGSGCSTPASLINDGGTAAEAGMRRITLEDIRRQGLTPIVRMGNVALVIDPNERNPLEGKANCLDAIYRCADSAMAAESSNFYAARHQCILRMDACPTTTPSSACCPARCIEQYRELTNGGLDNRTAYDRALRHGTSCFPGLESWLVGR